MEDRKKDHIELAFQSQTPIELLDKRFNYEPYLAAHPVNGLPPMQFLGKTCKTPMWVSSMTGGTQLAYKINHNLAQACREFGFGMGLGSCRSILKDDTHFRDFDMRDVIGDDLPFFANLGICQVEELVEAGKFDTIKDLVKRLRADGLIVHVNPMQEWFQPEGDVIKYPPLQTLKKLLDKVNFPVITKEVGQGIGPESLRELLKLPLAAIEFGAFGGTNFAKVELLRDLDAPKELYEPFSLIGMDVYEMLDSVNAIVTSERNVQCKEIIISGGVHSFLDGYYLVKKSRLNAVYGQASAFLKYAREDYEVLQSFVLNQIKGLEMAYAYLQVKA
jgi:isopentenyl-diphosphate delta-isomerase